MSRIGKKGIELPPKTEIIVSGKNVLVRGPLGEISRDIREDFSIEIKDSSVSVVPHKQDIESLALWGTYTSHIVNMVSGVNKLFEKKLILEGIGYKVEVKGDKVAFALGFSHPVEILIPEGLNVKTEKNAIIISGINKEAVGGFAAYIRSLKKPEPYKGKGIRYEGEIIKMKQGKKSV
jgi:large subunit ribosomal protein L6